MDRLNDDDDVTNDEKTSQRTGDYKVRSNEIADRTLAATLSLSLSRRDILKIRLREIAKLGRLLDASVPLGKIRASGRVPKRKWLKFRRLTLYHRAGLDAALALTRDHYVDHLASRGVSIFCRVLLYSSLLGIYEPGANASGHVYVNGGLPDPSNLSQRRKNTAKYAIS